jgi:lysozyme
MPTTDRGLLALARHEGVVPAPYLDVKRVWTFGIGHTAAAGAPDPARMSRGMPADLDAGVREAFRLFRADLGRDEAEVLRADTVPRAASSMCSSPSITTPARSPGRCCRAHNPGDRAAAGAAVHELASTRQPRVPPRRPRFGRGRSKAAIAHPAPAGDTGTGSIATGQESA